MPTTSLFSQVGLDTLFSREMNVAYIFFFSASKQGPQDPPAAGPQPQQPGEFPEKQKKNPFHFPDEHLIIHFPIPPDLAGSRDL